MELCFLAIQDEHFERSGVQTFVCLEMEELKSSSPNILRGTRLSDPS